MLLHADAVKTSYYISMGSTNSAKLHHGLFIKLLNDDLSNSNEKVDGNEVGVNKLDEQYFRV